MPNRVMEVARRLTRREANIRVANLACDTDWFKPAGPKENIVMTAGLVDKGNIIRKGFDTFVVAAKYLPQIKFYLVGLQWGDGVDKLKAIATPNVVFTGFLSDEDLLKMYQRAKVFCLLSYLEGEGGGGVLGEAMSCGCIPVISRHPALIETVWDCGLWVPYGDVKATIEAIKIALAAPAEVGEAPRERIVEHYSMEKREKVLLEAIEGVLK